MFFRLLGIAIFGLLFVLGVYIIWGVANQDAFYPEIEVDNISRDQQEKVKVAAKKLFRACKGLVEHKNAIKSLYATTNKMNGLGAFSYPKKYGWDNWVSFIVDLKEYPDVPRNWRVYGERLGYAVGPTGIVVTKDKAGYFCGRGFWSGFIAFK